MDKKTNAPQNNFIMHPTNDVCFSGLMENPVVRKGFCAAVLRISPDEILDTELLPTHLHRDYVNDKLGILDVLVRMPDGIQINMEMQIKDFEFWDERALFYLSKMYTGQLKSGEDYENLQKCIHVSILDFIHFPEDNRCFRTLHFRDDDTGKLYSNKLELRILELKKSEKEQIKRHRKYARELAALMKPQGHLVSVERFEYDSAYAGLVCALERAASAR